MGELGSYDVHLALRIPTIQRKLWWCPRLRLGFWRSLRSMPAQSFRGYSRRALRLPSEGLGHHLPRGEELDHEASGEDSKEEAFCKSCSESPLAEQQPHC